MKLFRNFSIKKILLFGLLVIAQNMTQAKAITTCNDCYKCTSPLWTSPSQAFGPCYTSCTYNSNFCSIENEVCPGVSCVGGTLNTDNCTCEYDEVEECGDGSYVSPMGCAPCPPNPSGFGGQAASDMPNLSISACYIPAGSGSDEKGNFSWSQMNFQ